MAYRLVCTTKYTYLIQLTKIFFFLSSKFQREGGGHIPQNPFSGSVNARAHEITWRSHGKISREHDNETKLNIPTYFRHMLGILVLDFFFKNKKY